VRNFGSGIYGTFASARVFACAKRFFAGLGDRHNTLWIFQTPFRVIQSTFGCVLSHQTTWGLDGLNPTRLPPSFLMGDIVNLRSARKRQKRRESEQSAAANRLVHGRTKAERTQTRSASDKAQRDLDQHRVERGDGQ
jgi:Domain of unknown function (DUF4169)